MLKHTPLRLLQQATGATFGKFGNYELVLKFKDYNTKDVTMNTRKKNHCTIFDISHVRVFNLLNPNLNKLERIFPINTTSLINNRSALSVVLNEKCEIEDDFIVSNINGTYRFVANNTEFGELLIPSEGIIENPEKVVIAIQGDKSQEVVEKMLFLINRFGR